MLSDFRAPSLQASYLARLQDDEERFWVGGCEERGRGGRPGVELSNGAKTMQARGAVAIEREPPMLVK